MEERIAVDLGQNLKTVFLEDGENGPLCMKDCSRDKAAVESHGMEVHHIVLADSGSRGLGFLLVLDNCFADTEVNVPAFAYRSQRDSP